jgi:hypothetical protein
MSRVICCYRVSRAMSSYWQSHVCQLLHRTCSPQYLHFHLSSTRCYLHRLYITLLYIAVYPLVIMSMPISPPHTPSPISIDSPRHDATYYLPDKPPTLAHWLTSYVDPVWMGELSGFERRCTICEQTMCDCLRKAAIQPDDEVDAQKRQTEEEAQDTQQNTYRQHLRYQSQAQ